MRNSFQAGTLQAGVGMSGPILGGACPLRMGQRTAQDQALAQKAALEAQENANAAMKAAVQAEAAAKASGARPKLSPSKDRFQWAVNRLCTMMRKLAESNANEQAISRVFWAYVKHARSSDESVITAYKTLCPELPVPPKPVKKVQDKPEVLVPMTYAEAVQVSGELGKALQTATVDEVVARADATTEGALAPEDLPKVEALNDEIVAFVAAGDTGVPLSVGQEQVIAAEKAIAQASEIGTEKTTKGLLTAAAVVGAGALVYFLL